MVEPTNRDEGCHSTAQEKPIIKTSFMDESYGSFAESEDDSFDDSSSDGQSDDEF